MTLLIVIMTVMAFLLLIQTIIVANIAISLQEDEEEIGLEDRIEELSDERVAADLTRRLEELQSKRYSNFETKNRGPQR